MIEYVQLLKTEPLYALNDPQRVCQDVNLAFNLVCGKTSEQATRPNLERIPNPQGPKIIDARVTTPTMRRREFSQPRDTYGRPPAPPTRASSLYLPFGSYAEMGVHTKAPGR